MNEDEFWERVVATAVADAGYIDVSEYDGTEYLDAVDRGLPIDPYVRSLIAGTAAQLRSAYEKVRREQR